jgi:hypothetical protein
VSNIFFRFWKIANFIILSILIIICLLGTFYKQITFGAGLGDMFGYIFLYCVTFLHLILTIVLKKRKIIFVFLSVIFAFITVQICLAATIWRGQEYHWNGEIFYLPCPHYIGIKNKDVEKTIVVQMCTGDNNSEIVAIWNGKLMNVEGGTFLIPRKLKKYIKYPIEYITIESYYTQVLYKDNDYYFKSDTLQVGKKYLMEGEIEKIEYGIPTFRVFIKEDNDTSQFSNNNLKYIYTK